MTNSAPRSLLLASLFMISLVGASLVPLPDMDDERAVLSLRAQNQDTAGTAAVLPPVLPSDESFRGHADLLGIDVDSPGHRGARDEYDAMASEISATFDEQVDAEWELSLLAAEQAEQLAVRNAATARRDAFTALAVELDESISGLAVEVFIETDPSKIIAALEDPANANNDERGRLLTIAAVDSLIAERDTASENAARAETTRAGAATALLDNDRRTQTALERLGAASESAVRLAPELASRRDHLENERALATVVGSDFTFVALDAYYRAADVTSLFDPGCGLEWWGLAGISKVEGKHGTYGGAQLDIRGVADPPIIGIALNGSNATAVISDTDGGLLDGDPVHDRAVGPMQFIPGTWRSYAVDGDGDGVASPHNLYDATLTAANYLCTASRGLGSDAGLSAAYFAYNHSDAYVSEVLGHARRYQTLLDLDQNVR